MNRKIRMALLAVLMTAVMLPHMVFAGEEKMSVPEEEETQIQEETSVPEEEETQIQEEPGMEQEAGPKQQDPDQEESPEAEEEQPLKQVTKILPLILGLAGDDPASKKEWIAKQVKRFVKNPGQYSEDFWDSLFGTGADGISKESDSEEKGKVEFVMDLPDPVRMPDTYSVAYHRLDKKKNEVITILERDADGNIHYLDGENETVFVKTEEGFRMYPVLADRTGFGKWDGTLLSARSVREKTAPFWNCADQTFIKWLGVTLTEETEYLGRPCGLYHAEPGAITFTYKCDMVIDDETGICLCYTADELLKGAVFNVTDDDRVQIDIGDYHIGGDEMNFFCTAFETENISFEVPEV